MHRCMVPTCEHESAEWFGGTALCPAHAQEVRDRTGLLRARATTPPTPRPEGKADQTPTAPHAAA